jgi:cytochrome c553
VGFASVEARADEPAANKELTGEQIWAAQCARCHGKMGEGTEEHYPDPLVGDMHVSELAALIDKTMPEGAPEKLNADESRRVAAYLYDAFYSPVAQARNRPARIELSRLTVRQYQNAVTDLIGSFRRPSQWVFDTSAAADGSGGARSERGLKGEYFKGRQPRGGERVIDRVDPQVKFDFGEEAPHENLEAHQFSISWEGSVFAPDTGDYEFIVRTEHAARLWVNDLRDPLIDAWVKSGNDTEYRQSIRLLGGRPYAIRLEFSKAKQGVDDSDKNKNKPPPKVKASIELAWKLPHLPAETIPARFLAPQTTSELFVLTAPFPPDDRSMGYERGTAISKAWDQATTDAAIETAGYVAERLDELIGLRQRERGQSGRRRRDQSQDQPQVSTADREAKLREFCRRFAERAFRRPLSPEQQALIDRQFEAAESPEAAVKRVVLLALKSPWFLYREIGAAQAAAAGETHQPDPYDVAARLSFGLWDSLPDDELLAAAAEGRLATKEQIAAQAERMLADLRTRSKVRQFFLQWLKIDQIPDMAKSPERYPEFNESVAADLRASLDLFLDQVVWSEKSDFRELLLADWLPLNGRLASLYGGQLDPESAFEKVTPTGPGRAGLLSHPYLLAAFAYTETTSPIHRGVFISRSLLGRALKPPPIAVSPLSPDLHKDLTTRERVALQTNSAACMSCHGMINPLGFTLEHYDAIGRYRSEEQGKPIDAKGEYVTRGGDKVQFGGVRDLAKFLSNSDETHSAFVQQLFHNLVKQPIRAYSPHRLSELKAEFKKNEFNIQKLVATIVATSAAQQVSPAGRDLEPRLKID